MTIRIASEFSRVPAGRMRTDGPFSGERFRDDFLIPALKRGDQVRIVFDGARGYGSSFLEEAFGGLVRQGLFPVNDLERRLEFISEDDPSIALEVKGYIKNEAVRSS
ncbi:STAS-like domain-containing protein [Aromatoleum toluclasticum]|uniref:STAS-like domain-containing protein n=1 Tax=Aromatoleum toluclasticum TaxID=92003 RepID=UPI001D181AB6|nr:STAS-like domain-containing protein [Aromatoleum toluclasticum]MCC4117593.1 STAS-like domain-containing protein [Aromatoleum toluclasticum]